MAECNYAPTNGVGVPTHSKNEIRTASRVRTLGFGLVLQRVWQRGYSHDSLRVLLFPSLRISHLQPEKIAYSD